MRLYKRYHWNGAVHVQCQCHYDNNRELQGVYKSYYKSDTFCGSGKLRTECYYKDGKLHGVYTEYYVNGEISKESNYKDGKLEGLEKWYYKNGNLKIESNYKNGKREGVYYRFYKNGTLEIEANYKMVN